MNPTSSVTYIGIDICKDFLDVYLPDWDTPKRFPNAPDGFRKLFEALPDPGAFQLVVESTGGYERDLRLAAAEAQILLSMVNPRMAREFAKASGQLAKTDALDAKTLAAFGEAFQPRPSVLPPKNLQKLKDLGRHRASLNDFRLKAQSYLEKAREPSITRQTRSHIRFLEKQIAKVEEQMIQLMDSDPVLADKRQRLEQIKGVGPIVSATLLAELPELGSLPDPKIVSLCGLAPFNRDSGHYKGKRKIIGGRGRIRRTLYMPTVCAITHNPPLNELYQRLKQKGKPGKVAITAVMRKLICLLNRMISDPTFQPQ